MSTEIKCPNCGHEFEPTDSIREEVQKEFGDLRPLVVEVQIGDEERGRHDGGR